MLGKSHLCGMGRRSYIDYRKMTNGFVSVRNAHAQSHYPTGLETTRGGLAPSQGARLFGNEDHGEDADAMARGVFELMKAPGCLKGCWCGERWFDRLTMTDRGGRGAMPGRQAWRPTIGGGAVRGGPRKTTFCETNPPVKCRHMNLLGNRWCKSGKDITPRKPRRGEPRESTGCPNGLHETACQKAGEGGSIRRRLE